ncbi:unnamed protein product [Amoebophrya sp. A120]|nr:unnamed protein product [Amoebophrya sp. A120]|eukprot:GSA120T00008127001.1
MFRCCRPSVTQNVVTPVALNKAGAATSAKEGCKNSGAQTTSRRNNQQKTSGQPDRDEELPTALLAGDGGASTEIEDATKNKTEGTSAREQQADEVTTSEKASEKKKNTQKQVSFSEDEVVVTASVNIAASCKLSDEWNSQNPGLEVPAWLKYGLETTEKESSGFGSDSE